MRHPAGSCGSNSSSSKKKRKKREREDLNHTADSSGFNSTHNEYDSAPKKKRRKSKRVNKERNTELAASNLPPSQNNQDVTRNDSQLRELSTPTSNGEGSSVVKLSTPAANGGGPPVLELSNTAGNDNHCDSQGRISYFNQLLVTRQ